MTVRLPVGAVQILRLVAVDDLTDARTEVLHALRYQPCSAWVWWQLPPGLQHIQGLLHAFTGRHVHLVLSHSCG